MKPFKLYENIFWAGALHPDLKVFDIIMKTKNGTTYNSYLILDDKVAVIDTVKGKFSQSYLEHISNLVDPKQIDYIIMQHNEPDHSGSLKTLLKEASNAQIVCSRSAVKYVKNIINQETSIKPVSNGDVLDLGKYKPEFYTAPYCHWPDTMMTYFPEIRLLFSSDLLASHFCDSRMVDQEIDREFWPDFREYFQHIMRPYKKNVRNVLAKIDQINVEAIPLPMDLFSGKMLQNT